MVASGLEHGQNRLAEVLRNAISSVTGGSDKRLVSGANDVDCFVDVFSFNFRDVEFLDFGEEKFDGRFRAVLCFGEEQMEHQRSTLLCWRVLIVKSLTVGPKSGFGVVL